MATKETYASPSHPSSSVLLSSSFLWDGGIALESKTASSFLSRYNISIDYYIIENHSNCSFAKEFFISLA